MAHRVQQAKKLDPKWDRKGEYVAKCAELARAVGLEPHVVVEEHHDRAEARFYQGGIDVDQAEALAWIDVLSQFEVVL